MPTRHEHIEDIVTVLMQNAMKGIVQLDQCGACVCEELAAKALGTALFYAEGQGGNRDKVIERVRNEAEKTCAALRAAAETQH